MSAPFANDAWFGGYSAPVTTTTQQKATVSLNSSTYGNNTPVPTQLMVNPAVNGAAALQRWNGKTWVFFTNVAITPEGRRLVTKADRIVQGVYDDVLGTVGAKQRAEFVAVLQQLVAGPLASPFHMEKPARRRRQPSEV